MSVSIRRAAPADAPALASVAAATFALACPPGTTEANIALFIETSLSEHSFERYLTSPANRLWLAEEDGQPVGYAMAVHGEPTDPDIQAAVVVRPTVELSKIYVHESHHGTGVAEALMDIAITEAANSGAGSVWLGVNQQNVRANRFYEKQGFVLRGTRFFQVGDSMEADYVRERSLLPL
ncbi:MAG: GNAT family N-acetyltransferase [Pontimonas sp.]|nr:GNAT family N-acetyltransferase [Pontimonas sp.]